jgi:aryl-alcohol dehydrogenase-like predicted oxidoreductase
MIYTQYGKTGLKVSRFGLGCMRFPKDEKEAIQMVRFAIDHGVNYLDTAYLYNDSEVITGKALRDGYRDQAYLATKCPLGRDFISKYEDLEKCLDEELRRLGTDHIDVYLLHGLDFDRSRKPSSRKKASNAGPAATACHAPAGWVFPKFSSSIIIISWSNLMRSTHMPIKKPSVPPERERITAFLAVFV